MKRALAVLSMMLALPAAAHAQSLFGTQGLGVPLPGVDARARALGVSGVGLLGLSTSMLNPAEAAGIFRRGFTASYQPWSGSVELNDEKDDISGTRFPMMQIFYPINRFTFTLGYAGVYDQAWAIVAESSQDIGGQIVDINDVVRSTGGIGELRLGAATQLTERIALGVSAGLHTGHVQRSITRVFPDSSLNLLPFETRTRWRYSGPTATAGLRWDPTERMRLGASVQWSGTLKAKPDSGHAITHEYDMPLRFAAGASGQIAPRLLLTASATHASFSTTSFPTPGTSSQTVAQNTTDVGVGLEWSEIRAGDRVFPLRVGYRTAKLPFRGTGQESATETAFSGGIGFRLVQDDFGPLAVADIGFERGSRTGWESSASPTGLDENFWRFTVSMSLFGR